MAGKLPVTKKILPTYSPQAFGLHSSNVAKPFSINVKWFLKKLSCRYTLSLEEQRRKSIFLIHVLKYIGVLHKVYICKNQVSVYQIMIEMSMIRKEPYIKLRAQNLKFSVLIYFSYVGTWSYRKKRQ